MTKEKNIIAIKSAIQEVCDNASSGWVSVTEPGKSFSAIFTKHQVPKQYWSAFVCTLESSNVIKTDGAKRSLSYTAGTDVILFDKDYIAELIISNAKTISDGYAASSKSDLNNFVRSTRPRQQHNPNTKYVKKVLPGLRDTVFICLNDGNIYEATVVGTELDEENENKLRYKLMYCYEGGKTITTGYDFTANSVFCDLDSLFANMKKRIIRLK
jgi:hypothetical protein